MNEVYKKECPNCKKEMPYSTKYDLYYSIMKHLLCKSCSHVGKLPYKMTDEVRKKLKIARKGKTPNKGRKWSEEYKINMSNVLKGRVFTEEHKNKISMANQGKLFTEDHKKKLRIPKSEGTKYKLRIATINNLKNKGIKLGYKESANYNPKACEFIDKLNKEKGWNLQHALNGGEVELYGYFVDGYDKEKNIIFEYDEPHHKSSYRLKKDVVRQNNIINNVHPSKFIRYDKMNDKLYEVF